MKRPVKCRICRKQMYYFHDPRRTPEFVIDVFGYGPGEGEIEHFVVHQACWREKFPKERK